MKNKFKDLAATKQYYEEADRLITNPKLELLQRASCHQLHDTKDVAYFFYKNYIVEVTKKGITSFSYDKFEQPTCVSEDYVLDRDFFCDRSKSVFESFLFMAMSKDEKRMQSMKSGIGYLLHRHAKKSETKAIILTDQASYGEFEAHGGTGKSITAEAISRMRKVVREDGKSFNPSFIAGRISCNPITTLM